MNSGLRNFQQISELRNFQKSSGLRKFLKDLDLEKFCIIELRNFSIQGKFENNLENFLQVRT